MNILDVLGPWKYLACAAIAATLIGGATYTVHRYNSGLREEGRAEIRAADKAAAEAQTTRNRELQRAAELRYTVVAQGQTRYLTRKTKEVHDAAAPLAACPVPVDAVRLLNDAAACARGDSPASCGAGDEVLRAR